MRGLFILTVAVLAVAAGAPVAASADTGQHGAILITSDTQFTRPARVTDASASRPETEVPAVLM